MSNIEFVSYDGSYPNLCSGILTVKINGNTTTFGYDWSNDCIKPNYPPFWKSGGCASFDKNWNSCVSEGDWELDIDNGHSFPKDILAVLPDIIKVMNENVPHGCCGGCL